MADAKDSSILTLPTVRGCLFDMDGLLINSDDIYDYCTNQVLKQYGKSEQPWSIRLQLQGRPSTEAQRIFFEWADLSISPSEFLEKEMALQRENFPRTKPLPGVVQLVSTLASQNFASRVHIALATSSTDLNFALKTKHLSHLFSLFSPECRILGDDTRIKPGRGKPAPDIYLLALEAMNSTLERQETMVDRLMKPEECLVFEDSIQGVKAGRSAGMQVAWCPHPGLISEYQGRERDLVEDLVGGGCSSALGGLNEFSLSKMIERASKGWIKYYQSLEDFDYHSYGIQVC